MPREFWDEGDVAVHPIKDHAVDLVHAARDEVDQRIKGRFAARRNTVNGRAHVQSCAGSVQIRQVHPKALRLRAVHDLVMNKDNHSTNHQTEHAR